MEVEADAKRGKEVTQREKLWDAGGSSEGVYEREGSVPYNAWN